MRVQVMLRSQTGASAASLRTGLLVQFFDRSTEARWAEAILKYCDSAQACAVAFLVLRLGIIPSHRVGRALGAATTRVVAGGSAGGGPLVGVGAANEHAAGIPGVAY